MRPATALTPRPYQQSPSTSFTRQSFKRRGAENRSPSVDGGDWFESTISSPWVEGSWANGVTVGSADISGLTVGDEIWLRIGEVRVPSGGTGGDLIIDNVAVAVVPEPSVALLGGLGLLGLIRRRR